MKDTIVKILTDERDSARRALSIYGGHVEPCPGRPCECGFKQAWDNAQLPATLGSVIDATVENSFLKAALRRIANNSSGLIRRAATQALEGSERTSGSES